MASRRRTAAASSSSSAHPGNQISSSSTLPPYTPPTTLPLNPNSLRALTALSAPEKSQYLRDQIGTALKLLADTAVELAEWVPAGEVAKDESSDDEEEERDEDSTADGEGRGRAGRPGKKQIREGKRLLKEAEEMTRQMVDKGWEVENSVGVLQGGVKSAAEIGTNQGNNAEGEEEEEEEKDSQEQRNNTGLWDVHRKEMTDLREGYARKSMKERYGEQGEYVEFRKLIWEAQHADGEDMPPVRSWFPQGNGPRSHPTTKHNASASTQHPSHSTQISQSSTFPPTVQPPASNDPSDSDDDLILQTTKHPTTCPLTLLPFQHPVTSTLCPHSFEKSAILEMLRSSSACRLATVTDGSSDIAVMHYIPENNRRGGGAPVPPGYVRVAKCPVSGCTKTLSEAEIKEDNVLARRMKREKERKEREEMERGLDESSAGGRNNRDNTSNREGQAIELGDESFLDADMDVDMDVKDEEDQPQAQEKGKAKGNDKGKGKGSRRGGASSSRPIATMTIGEDSSEEEEE